MSVALILRFQWIKNKNGQNSLVDTDCFRVAITTTRMSQGEKTRTPMQVSVSSSTLLAGCSCSLQVGVSGSLLKSTIGVAATELVQR